MPKKRLTQVMTIREEQGLRKLAQAIFREKDLVMVILRAHLLTENILEQFIRIGLPRGFRIIEDGNLTYHQKLILVSGLDLLPDEDVSALRNLNKVRNECAHQIDKVITESDVAKIGSPLGKWFTKIRHDAKFDNLRTLKGLVSYIVGHMDGHLHAREALAAELKIFPDTNPKSSEPTKTRGKEISSESVP